MHPAFAPLRGARVQLRDFDAGDLDAFHSIAGDDRVTSWLSFDSRDRDTCRSMLDAVIRSTRAQPRGEYYLAITGIDDTQVIGFARLARSGVKAAKLGYAVHADHWGHGYATEAVRLIVDHGFTGLGVHRITAAVGPENAASLAVLSKLDFSYEGRLRDHVHTNGSWRDSLLYSLLEPEWQRATQPTERPPDETKIGGGSPAGPLHGRFTKGIVAGTEQVGGCVDP